MRSVPPAEPKATKLNLNTEAGSVNKNIKVAVEEDGTRILEPDDKPANVVDEEETMEL